VLLVEHGILILFALSLAHVKVVEVLNLTLQQFECFLSFSLISELGRQRGDNVIQTSHNYLLEVGERCLISLSVEVILEGHLPLAEHFA